MEEIPKLDGTLIQREPAPLDPLPQPNLDLPPLNTVRPPDGGSSVDADYERLKMGMSQFQDPRWVVEPVRYDDPMYGMLEGTFNGKNNDLFNKKGFYPGINNEDRYARGLTNWEKLGVAMGNMGALAKDTFAEQWKTEAEFWGNLVTGDVKEALLPFNDPNEMERMYQNMNEATRTNYVPLTLEEQSGQFGFGKFATTLGQFGFTLGTVGAFATQMGLEIAAAALLAPETAGASIAAEGASLTNKIKQLFTLGKFYRNLEKVENGVQSANKLRRAYEWLSDTKNLKQGFGRFYSFTKEWNAAAGEAKFEAASSYGDYLRDAQQNALKDGKVLDYGQLEAAKEVGMKIANRNGMTNTGLLFMMNRLNMGNLFRGPFNPQKRFMTELFPDAEKIGENLVKDATKGWMRKNAVPLFSKLGAKQAGLHFGEWALDSAWEGVQEVAQGASANYWNSYYKGNYDRKSMYDRMSLIGQTVKEKLDDNQSFEEFISGFVIGAPGSMLNIGIGKGQQALFDPGGQKRQNKILDDYAKQLNEFEADPLRVFDPRVKNINNQTAYAANMDEAVKRGDIYAYKNFQKQQMRDMIMLGMRTGKLDYMLGLMKDYANNLKPEEFKEVFNLVDDATNRKTVGDYVSLFEQKAEQIVKDYDQTKQKFPNPYANFKGLKKDSEAYKIQAIKYSAWEDLVEHAVFEKDNFQDTFNRMKSILGDAKDVIGDALYEPFFTATSKENTDRELTLLRAEIASLRQAENKDAATKKLLAQKENYLKNLEAWNKHTTLLDQSQTQENDFNESLARFTDEAKSSFQKLMKDFHSSVEGASDLTSDQLDSAYNYVLDYMRLQKDNKTSVRNISMLSSPEEFDQQFQRSFIEAEAFYQNEMNRRSEMILLKQAVQGALEYDSDFNNITEVKTLKARLQSALEDRDYADIDDIYTRLAEIYRDLRMPKSDETKTEEETTSEDNPETPPAGTPGPVTGPSPVSQTGGNSRSVRLFETRIKTAKDRKTLDKISADLSNPGKFNLSADEAAELQKKVEEKYTSFTDADLAANELYENTLKRIDNLKDFDEGKALYAEFLDRNSKYVKSLPSDLYNELQTYFMDRMQRGFDNPPASQTGTQAGSTASTNEAKLKAFDKTIEREYEDGDYAKVLSLAQKQVKNGTIEQTLENLQLLANYPGLFEELIKATEARDKTIAEFDNEAVLVGKPKELPIYGIEAEVNPATGKLNIKWVVVDNQVVTNIQTIKLGNYAADALFNFREQLANEQPQTLKASKTEYSKKIEDIESKEDLAKLHEEIKNLFTDSELAELELEILKKSSTFVDPISTTVTDVNQSYDLTDIDNFDINSLPDLNDLSSTTGTQTSNDSNEDDTLFEPFKSCNI